MKTAIFYSSKHGTTAKVAALLAEKLEKEQPRLIDLHAKAAPPVQEFDRIIIGGSIHIGTIQKSVKRFCEKNLEQLLQIETTLLICCLQKEKEKEQFDRAYPLALREHSMAHGFFGGELLMEKMNFIEKFIVKKVAGKDKSFSALDYAAIDRFVRELKEKSSCRMKC